MRKEIEIRIPPELLDDHEALREKAGRALGISVNRIVHLELIKRSIDARSRHPVFLLRYLAHVDEPFEAPSLWNSRRQNCPQSIQIS